MTTPYERGAQRARQRNGTAAEPNPYDNLPPTGLNRGKLNALARYGDQEQRRNAAATLRRWDTTPPAEDDSGTAA